MERRFDDTMSMITWSHSSHQFPALADGQSTECCVTILYHAIKTTPTKFRRNKIAVQDGKVGLSTLEYTTAFLYSHWLYFLWHGINANTSLLSTVWQKQQARQFNGG